MDTLQILKKSLSLVWRYRALWLFGAVLALVGAKMILPGPWNDWEENDQWTKIIIADTTTIQVPGVDMIIDLTSPGGVRIITPDYASWQEFRDLVELLDREVLINLWPILIELTVILFVLFLLGLLARYVAETALVRMVSENEDTGRHLSVKEGLHRGFSKRAWRLFLLDLVVGVLGALAFIVVFGLAVAPILLAIGSNETVLITVGIGTIGLLTLATYLVLAAAALLSLVMQPIRRACALEDQSLWASIRQGIGMTKHHLKEVGVLWLIWMGIRLLWVPVSVLVLVILLPLLLVTMLLGVAVAGLPAALAGAITALFIDGATPWIMGALVGIPIFIVVMILPMLFVSGLVEIYKSSIWTLAYRDLMAMDRPVESLSSQAHVTLVPETAD